MNYRCPQRMEPGSLLSRCSWSQWHAGRIPCSAEPRGTAGSVPGSRRCGGGNGNPLPGFLLPNPRDRGARWATVCGVQVRQGTEQLSTHSTIIVLETSAREWHGHFTFIPLEKYDEDLTCSLHALTQKSNFWSHYHWWNLPGNISYWQPCPQKPCPEPPPTAGNSL